MQTLTNGLVILIGCFGIWLLFKRLLSSSRSRKGRGYYVASRASIPERAEMWRGLREQGVPINSTWIDEAGDGETADLSELWTRVEREVRSSEALILYVAPGDFPLKGAYVEVGIALGCGIPVRVVMPGVEVDPRTCRPVGSWINHPVVTIHETLREAFEG